MFPKFIPIILHKRETIFSLASRRVDFHLFYLFIIRFFWYVFWLPKSKMNSITNNQRVASGTPRPVALRKFHFNIRKFKSNRYIIIIINMIIKKCTTVSKKLIWWISLVVEMYAKVMRWLNIRTYWYGWFGAGVKNNYYQYKQTKGLKYSQINLRDFVEGC